MTDIDWPALLALEGQATAGPWDVDALGRVYDEDGVPLCDTRDDEGDPLGGQTRAESQANAEFVGEVRGAFPALVALVRDLAEALALTCSTLDRYADVVDGDQGRPTPNPAMAAMQRIEAMLATVPAALRVGVGDDA